MHTTLVWVSFLCVSLSQVTADELPRPQLSLDGQWQFKLDPQGRRCRGPVVCDGGTFPDKIMVPGNWQAQGFGEPRGIAKHDYQGKAWYRRGFTVPTAWQGQRVWLRFEGVCNWGEVFLDGAQVGRVDSFVTPQEFDITERIRLGREQRLDVLVDSKTPADSPYIGMMQFLVASGGITSHVRLEARPDPQLDRIRLRAEPGLKGVLASVSARRAQAGATLAGTLPRAGAQCEWRARRPRERRLWLSPPTPPCPARPNCGWRFRNCARGRPKTRTSTASR